MRRKTKTKKSKLACQKIHAKKRARQRHGIILSDRGIQTIVTTIQNGQAELIERQSMRVGIYKVSYDGYDFKVVYDRKRKTLATVLPISA